MNNLALDIWNLLRKNNINCVAYHIPGTTNIADSFSRKFRDRNDFSLDQSIFDKVIEIFDTDLHTDLFASRLTRKLNSYVSWKLDPFAWKIDSFSFSWPNDVYIFPPINLINNCITKFIHDSVENGILITPSWPSLTCYHRILDLLISDPIFLPSYTVTGCLHQCQSFNWMAWHISSKIASQEEFRRKRQTRSRRVFPLPRYLDTCDIGKNFIVGMRHIGIHVLCPFP